MSEENEENQEDTKAVRKKGPNAVDFVPHQLIWERAKTLAADRSSRVDELAVCVSQDPVLVLELLKTANALFFSPGSNPITSTKTALVRLGSDAIVELLDGFSERPKITDPDVSRWFEFYRGKAKRTSIVCRVLAQSLAPNLKEDCQTSGLFVSVGEMLAVAFLKERFVDLANNKSAATLAYHLTQHLSFDPEKMGLGYLRHHGIPEILIFPIDRDSRPPQASLTIMRPLVMSARELVDAFDNDRWEKVAPGQSLSAKSNLRLLQMNDAQYLRIYERVAEYLFSEKLAEARQEMESAGEAVEEVLDLSDAFAEAADDEGVAEDENLDQQIEDLLSDFDSLEDSFSDAQEDAALEDLQDAFDDLEEEIEEQEVGVEEVVILGPKKSTLSDEERPDFIAPPKKRKRKTNPAFEAMESLIDQVDSSEDLITGILGNLVDGGGFKKTALIVVSDSRESAQVVAARGLDVDSGQILQLNDPLSPLAHCFSKIQSFGTKPSSTSPFGSKAFAVSPINAEFENPVALYADCGEETITLEGRRLFRHVVDILNRTLPTIPGGIPVDEALFDD